MKFSYGAAVFLGAWLALAPAALAANDDPLQDPTVRKVRDAFRLEGLALFDIPVPGPVRGAACTPDDATGITTCATGTSYQTSDAGAYGKSLSYHLDAKGRVVHVAFMRREFPLERARFDDTLRTLGARYGGVPTTITFQGKTVDGFDVSSLIAVWGGIKLVRFSAAELRTVAAGGAVGRAPLVDHRQDVRASAQRRDPVYKIVGSAGYVVQFRSVTDVRTDIVQRVIYPAGFEEPAPEPKPVVASELLLDPALAYHVNLAQAEAERRAAVERARREEDERKAAAARRLEAEREAAAELARLDEEKRKAELERARIAEEALKAEAERARRAEEERVAAEARRAAEEHARREEAERKAAEVQKAAEERARREEAERKAAEERARRAEAEREAAEERRQAEERARRAEAERKAAEQRRLAEERVRAEADRKAAEEKRAMEERAQRAEAEYKAAVERARKAEAERLAAEERVRRAEAQRKAAEDRAKRIEAERKAAEVRARHEEEERKAAEERVRKLEAERKAADEHARSAAEAKRAEDARRVAAERARREVAERRRAEAERQADVARKSAATPDRVAAENRRVTERPLAEQAPAPRPPIQQPPAQRPLAQRPPTQRPGTERNVAGVPDQQSDAGTESSREDWLRMASARAKNGTVHWVFNRMRDRISDDLLLQAQAVFAGSDRLSIEIAFECNIDAGKRLKAYVRAFDARSKASLRIPPEDGQASVVRGKVVVDGGAPQTAFLFPERDERQASIVEVPITHEDIRKNTPRARAWLRHYQIAITLRLQQGEATADIYPYDDNLRRVLEGCVP